MSIQEPSSVSTDSLTTTAPYAVPLSRSEGETQGGRQQVWSIDSVVDPALSIPLPTKCDKHGRPDGICCKDLNDDDNRQLVDPDIVRDMYELELFLL